MNLSNNQTIVTLRKLYSIFNRHQKRKFIWLIFLTFIGSITDLLGLAGVIPIVGLVLNDEYYNSLIKFAPFISNIPKEHLLLILTGLFFLVIIAKNAFGLYINKVQVNFVRNLYMTSTENVLHNVYDRTLLDIQKDTSNELVSKLTSMQFSLCSNAAISTIILINETMVFALTAISICLWNWHLFLLMIGIVAPTVGLFYVKVKDMIKTAGTEKHNKTIELYARAQEMIFGYIDVKISGTENFFKKRFKNIANNYSFYQGKLDFMLFIPTRIIEVAIFVCILVLMLYGVYFIKDSVAIITTITMFSVVAYRSIPSVNRFVIAMNNLNAVEFIFDDPEFMINDKREDTSKDAEPLHLREQINFKDVYYQYNENTQPVLTNINLQINRGEKIGIVGKSGSGKSTMVNNILGFLTPTRGHISVDGVAIDEANVRNWWRTLGYVRQEVFIMNATLKENIAIGVDANNIDEAQMAKAVRLASLADLVAYLPDGLDTMLNERGNNLSGGQKQRIAIARAIYKGAEVLVFDEATSALDTKTEEEITNAINQLGKEDLTIIIIAHRYSSLRFCEKIYKLEKGIISHTYSYEELMQAES